MGAVRSGDAAAATALLRVAWPAAYRIARSIVSDSAAAEDAAQEACARALGAIASLRRADRFAPWFYRIVVNEAKQRLRITAREVPFESDSHAHPRIGPDEARLCADRLDVRGAIDALDPSLRAAIVLRYYFGMSSLEIGSILGTSPVTARWRLMRAHRKLRDVLEPGRGPVRGPQRSYADESQAAG